MSSDEQKERKKKTPKQPKIDQRKKDRESAKETILRGATSPLSFLFVCFESFFSPYYILSLVQACIELN